MKKSYGQMKKSFGQMKGNLQIEGKENYEQMEEKLWIDERKAMDR